MNQYVTGSVIRKLREKKHMTQSELAEKISVSAKAVSKWENGHGFPDITLLTPIADALGISTIELFSGNAVTNSNRSSNMLKSPIYVCPVCGNVIHSTGEAVISCCGILLPPLEAEEPDSEHLLEIEPVEDEWYVTTRHPMTKEHYISFLAAVSDNGFQLVKLYPEGNAEARFKITRTKMLYCYCNRHGLYQINLKKK
ncbi:MAG: helix-turn-helix domain-containing protein [Roseburia sp.]